MIFINFILCSGLLLIVYRLLLANEKMFTFNRWYLILSLVFSLGVPFIPMATLQPTLVADVYHGELIIQPNYPAQAEANPAMKPPVPVQAPVDHNYLPYLIAGIYGLVTLVLLARFGVNLYRISRATRGGQKVSHGNATLILVNKDIDAHSFLNYIFVNKYDFDNGLIEPQIICHEQAHARQLHTLDILFVELLQVFCWFNPAIPFYRQAIQLNHEFLADDTVIANEFDTPEYQLLLLAKSGRNNNLALTSQFNYLTTKKRLIMMTRNTNTKMAIGKQFAIAPVIALAVLLFSHKVVAMDMPVANDNHLEGITKTHKPENFITIKSGEDAPQSVLNEYLRIEKKYKMYRSKEKPKVRGFNQQVSKADDERLRILFKQMSKAQQQQQVIIYHPYSIIPKPAATEAEMSQWKDTTTYGVWLDDKRVKGNDLSQYKPGELIHNFTSRLMPVAVKNDGFHYQVELMTQAYYHKNIENLKEQNKNGGFRMYNFKLLKDNPKLRDEFTTDQKIDFAEPVAAQF